MTTVYHIHPKTFGHLGFIIDSVTMTVSLPADKTEKIIKVLEKLLREDSVSIRELARAIGLVVSTFPAVTYGRLHYRAMERQKMLRFIMHLVILIL